MVPEQVGGQEVAFFLQEGRPWENWDTRELSAHATTETGKTSDSGNWRTELPFPSKV